MRFLAVLLATAMVWSVPKPAQAQTAQASGVEKISTSGWCVLFIDGAPERDAPCQMDVEIGCDAETEACGAKGKIRYHDGRVSIYSVEQDLTFIDGAQATPKPNRCWEYVKGGDTFCMSLLPTYDHLLARSQPVSNTQTAQAGSGLICLVMRGGREISRKPCTRTIEQNVGCEEGCKRVQRFRWPDGDVTVLANQEESFELNGVGIDKFKIDGSRWCFENPRTGNSFCYLEG
ncbi:MAG: hypothetical protein AAFO61_14285 [Pseudomonadota bacterium]